MTDKVEVTCTTTSSVSEIQKTLLKKQQERIPCTVQCWLAGVKTNVLQDTDLQVSMIGLNWKQNHLHDIEIRLLEEEGLNLTAGNGTQQQ